MRFLRIQADCDRAPPGIADLALRGQLDLLQLDYQRPHLAAAPTAAPAELPEYAEGFVDAVRELTRPLYLEPRLTVVASAGWANSFALVEQTARALVEVGCGDLPLAAVRGSNLLPLLEMIEASGIRLKNAETGAGWNELQGASLLAADLQIGAGPVATALAQGARVLVIGHCDPASPLTAASVNEFGWSWSDGAKLACAAVAARAAAWHGRIAGGDPLVDRPAVNAIEIDDSGELRVDVGRQCAPSDATDMTRWLRGKGDDDLALTHADVRCRLGGVVVEPAAASQLRIRNIDGRAGDGAWRLDVLVMAGYIAETIVELGERVDASWRQKIVSLLRDDAIDPDHPAESLDVRELGAADRAGEVRWLHLTCRTAKWTGCNRFAERIAAIAAAHRDLLRLPAGRPNVYARGEPWPTRIPRESVDLAIDTRPARDWQ